MKKSILTFFISLLLLCSSVSLMAQDNYELCTIFYQVQNGRGYLSISEAGKKFETIEVKFENKEDKADLNTNTLQKKVKEYSDKGWDVVTFTFTPTPEGTVHYACLKKKSDS